MMRIDGVEQLYRLRRHLHLPAGRRAPRALKKANVLRYALKYALWAVRPGGRIEIVDDGPDTFDIKLMRMPFSVVRQHCFKVYRDEAELVELDAAGLRLVFERRRLVTAPGWSAGLIFSGNAREMPYLARAIDALQAQPELSAAAGGQIMVCGPAPARPLLDAWPDVEYLAFEEVSSQRAFTTRKKNALIAAARNPRVAILHTRILLESGCLAAFPREFDVTTPRVVYREGERSIPYIDWVVAHNFAFDRLPHRLQSSLFYARNDHLAQLATGGLPYVDGGVFVGMRDVLRAVPLNPYLAWGEAEDNEWCSRLQSEGYLVDLDASAEATSQSFKLPRRLFERPGLWRRASALHRLAVNVGQRCREIFTP